MASEGCMRCIRYLVFVFNFLFWFVGIGLFGLAMFLKFGDTKDLAPVGNFAPDVITTLAYVLMAIGGVLTIVGFMGCCGAYQESTCLLGTFFLCLLLMLAGEVAAAIYGFVERDPIRNKYTSFLQQAAHEYGWSNRTIETTTLGGMQKMFHCCGALNYTDYEGVDGFYHSHSKNYPATCCTNTSVYTQTTPASRPATTTSPLPPLDVCTSGTQYLDGCAPKLFKWLMDNLLWVGIGVGIIAILEVIGMVMAILLCCHLRNLGYEATTDTENLMF